MPYMHTRFTGSITPEQEKSLKTGFGEAISLLPGKSEQWLMLDFEDHCRMWFRGSQDQPLAMVEISVFGSSTAAAYERLTAEVTALLGKVLDLDPACVYVKYTETAHWGWHGGNF